MPKVSEEHSETRRTQILEAAFRCFTRKGFQATTVREICGEAGLSAGAVYSYFPAKADIVAALAERYGRPRQARAHARLDPDREAPHGLGESLQSILAPLTRPESRDFAAFDLRLWGEALSVPELRALLHASIEHTRTPWVEAGERGQSDGSLPPGVDPETLADLLLAIVAGAEVLTALRDDFDAAATGRLAARLLAASAAAE